MLRDCERLLKPAGRLAFLTIHVAPGLAGDRRSAAIDAGPPAVEGPDDLRAVLEGIGFVDVSVADVTDDYRVTQRAWLEQWTSHADALIELLGSEMVIGRQGERRRTLAAIEDGLLRRSLVSASRR